MNHMYELHNSIVHLLRQHLESTAFSQGIEHPEARLKDCEDDVREGLGNVGDASLFSYPEGVGFRCEAGQGVRF